MDLSPMHVWSPHSDLSKLLGLFCFLWPFVALAFLRTRERSPAPLLAMLVPMALASCATWLGLTNVIRAMAISGGGRASTSAGIAEALMLPYFAVFSIGLIALFALIRRHRPTLDRVTAVIAGACLVEIIAAMLFAARVAPLQRQATLAMVWAGTALLVAVAAVVSLFLVTRRSPIPNAIPFGVTMTLLAFAITAVFVYTDVRRYVDIAMHG